MKIDLHAHTIGDGNRNIKREDLIVKLMDHGVELVAIADHHNFDEDLHNFLLSHNLTSIPAIEVSVDNNNKHIIVYSDKIEEIKRFNSEDGFSKDEFINRLNDASDLILISPHYMKDADRSFSDVNDVEEFFIEVKNPFIKYMLEFPSKAKVFDQKNNINRRYHISAFSDVKDWNKYNSKDLPNVDFKIRSLEEYVHYFVLSKENAFEFSKPEAKTFQYTHTMTNKDEKISLFPGLNIIFGAKGSGKTELLKSFENGNNDEFDSMNFSNNGNIEGLYKLYEKYKDNGMIESKKTKELDEIIDKINEVNSFSKVDIPPLTDTEIFIENAETHNKSTELKNTFKNISLLLEKKTDMTSKWNDQFLQIKKVYESIHKLIDVIENENYIGGIDLADIVPLLEKNINDLRKSVNFNFNRFVNTWEKKKSEKFKIVEAPKLNISKRINEILCSTKEIASIRNKIEDNLVGINRSISANGTLLFESDVLDKKYTFGYHFEKREDARSRTDDHERINQTTRDGMDMSLKFMDEISCMTIEKVIDNNFSNIEFALSNTYNIYFDSNFKGSDKYIPSSGQLDMLTLDSKMKNNNKNILIDEFCNSFDGDFVYNVIVPKMNMYNKIILATTHNPVVSVLPKIQKYIYMEDYDKFETDESYFGSLRNSSGVEFNTKEKIIKIIEGTKPAFDERKIIYEFK